MKPIVPNLIIGVKGGDNKMNKILAFVLIGLALFIGIGIGGSGSKDTPAPVTKTNTVYVDKNGDTWKQLKTIDDQGFSLASEGMGVCAEGYTAIGNGDYASLATISPKMKDLTTQINAIGVQRQGLLTQLGY